MFNVKWVSLFSGTRTLESHIYLVIAKPLLHLVEQAAVSQLTEGRQVIIGGWWHQLDLRRGEVKSTFWHKDLYLEKERILHDNFKVWDSGLQFSLIKAHRYCKIFFPIKLSNVHYWRDVQHIPL